MIPALTGATVPPLSIQIESRGELCSLEDDSGLVATTTAMFADTLLGDTDLEGRTIVPAAAELPDDPREISANDLLTDILEYRDLRARQLSGRLVDAEHKQRLERLEQLLQASVEQQHNTGFARSYRRFDYRFNAYLRTSDGDETFPVEIENISAGGVKLALPDPRPEGEQVWLILPRQYKGTVFLPSRVAWCRGQAIGLMFAGAPSWR